MVLGGGASINGLYYGRGSNAVYSLWEQVSGSSNWSLDNILATFNKLENYRSDPAFTAAERAALAYVEEVSKTKTAGDVTFEKLRSHFSDEQIAEITLLNAFENFYNLTNRPLGIESDNLCALIAR